ncbi:class I SAM-dependent methyltransferase [bacterium]|nr:class I SAM-dependent methyltransferase [bacterium]
MEEVPSLNEALKVRLERFDRLLQKAPFRAAGWKSDEARWDQGVMDSVIATERYPTLFPTQGSWLDVGSGNGLNGIPLSCLFPDLLPTFVERGKKRAEWLRETVSKMDLRGDVVCEDVRNLPKRLKGRFDLVTARALAPPVEAAKWLWPFVRKGGFLILFAGGSSPPPLLPVKGVAYPYSCNGGAPRALLLWAQSQTPN